MGQAGLNAEQRMRRTLAAVAQENTERLLSELIAIESHSETPGEEARLGAFIRNWLSERGIHCELHEVLPGRANLLARLDGPKQGPSLLLNGHLDTVPPYQMSVPFQAVKHEGKIYGRGTVDMKGALAAMMMAMAAIQACGGLESGTLYFAATVGEETYSPGAWQLSRSGFAADYAIIGEPTELRVGVAHKGVGWYEAEFPGTAAHGSVPERGVNAIYRAVRWIAHLQDVYIPQLRSRSHPLLGSPSLNVGVIAGGTRPVIVPGSCSVQFERRLIPGETALSALHELEQTLEETARVYPDFAGNVRIADNFHGVPHGPLATDPAARLAVSLIEACEAERITDSSSPLTNESAGPIGLQFWTDGALLQECCGQTVVCGPGSIAQAHSDDEYIEVGQLHAAVNIYIRAAFTLCTPEEDSTNRDDGASGQEGGGI